MCGGGGCPGGSSSHSLFVGCVGFARTGIGGGGGGFQVRRILSLGFGSSCLLILFNQFIGRFFIGSLTVSIIFLLILFLHQLLHFHYFQYAHQFPSFSIIFHHVVFHDFGHVSSFSIISFFVFHHFSSLFVI